MTGLIYDIKRFALHDGPGIRTTVFFKGCPLNCWWCHNPESRSPYMEKTRRINHIDNSKFEVEEITGYHISSSDLLTEILKDKAFMDESGGGVTFSGGEPLMQPDFLKEMIRLCKKEGIHVSIDTSGYADEDIFEDVAGDSDLFLFDIKHADPEMHKKYTSVSSDLILKNLDYLHLKGIPVIIRVPVIRGINDGGHLIQITELLNKRYPSYKQIHLLPYHNIASYKYERFGIENLMKDVKVFSANELRKMTDLLANYGFEVKQGG